jgi:hypothetical protein
VIVYFIVRNKGLNKQGEQVYHNPEWTDRNHSYKQAYGEWEEKMRHASNREKATVRRVALQQMKFQGKRPELIAKARAMRRMIERDINGRD